MTSVNPSIYIPFVNFSCSEEYISNIFKTLLIGEVNRVDLIRKEGVTPHYMAFIHFNYWYDNTASNNLRRKIIDEQSVRIVYDDPYYWVAYKNKNPIRSEKYPHILIYLRVEDAGEGGAYYTRILRLQSKKNKKFPKFFLRREGFFDKLRSDIDYRNNPEFSKKFFLKSLEKGANKLEVEKLFNNFSLQKKLISSPINIESNGDEIFYYWERVKFPVEELPKRISEIEYLHDNFFDQ